MVIPKSESADDVTTVSPILRRGKLLCLVETPRGVFASRELAQSSESVVGLMFGSADLSRELGATLTEGEPEVLFARSQVLMAARATGVAAYVPPHFAITDLDGLRRSSRAGRNLGYDGRAAIHPSHLETLNEIFAPTPEQIAAAERIVTAMMSAE